MKDDHNKRYDIIVVGAGSGGLTSAVGFAKIGKKVLLIEKEHMGGECTNSGCIPSKALLHHAKTYFGAKKVVGDVETLEQYRQEAMSYVRGKIDEILAQEQPSHFEGIGINVVMGEAVFDGRDFVRVGDDKYIFDRAVIATGSSPREIPIKGLKQEDTLTNQNVFTITEIPENLCILGAGPIGMELGQAFAMLGSNVTIISRDNRIANLEDEKISPIVQDSFDEHGIRVLYNAELLHVENKEAVVKVQQKNKNEEIINIHFDKFLVAIGRVPNMPQGLDAAGIKYNEHAVDVDSQYRTSNKSVYAVGDVAMRLKFTHTADDAARQVISHVVSRGMLRVNNKKAVPKVTYTSPTIAAVGLTYAQALDKYDERAIMRVEVPYGENDRAKTDDNTKGLMIVIVRRLSGRVVGANIVGESAGDMIALFTIAIDRKISMWKLRSTIYAYPTYGLLIKRAGDLFLAQTIKNLKNDVRFWLKKNSGLFILGFIGIVLLFILYNYFL